MAEKNSLWFRKPIYYDGSDDDYAIQNWHISGLVKCKNRVQFTNIFTNIGGFNMLPYASLWNVNQKLAKKLNNRKTLILQGKSVFLRR